MPLISDLIMPKLGLTMTEGRIAAWGVQPGERFTHGANVVVVETDKIANDIEAPGSGRLVEILAREGDVVPVGAPIARWELDDASGRSPAPVGDTAPGRAVEAAGSDVPLVTTGAVSQSGRRLIATPYARRLAREGGLRLEAIAGTGPRGRIRGSDVISALIDRSTVSSDRPPLPSSPLTVAEPAVAVHRAETLPATVSVIMIACECSSIADMLARLNGGTGGFTMSHVITLAAARALGGMGGDMGHTPVKLGIESEDGSLVSCAIPQRCGLGALARLLDRPEPVDGGSGDLAIHAASQGIAMFCPALPDSWPMVLGVAISGRGSSIEATLTLAYDQRRIAHRDASRLLTTIGQFLDDPLVLLAG